PTRGLAGVATPYGVEVIQPAQFNEIRRGRQLEFIGALVAFAGVVFLGPLQGILVAIVASLVALAYQAYNPPLYVLARKRGTHVFRERSAEHADDETWPRLLIVRTEGRLFFANRPGVGEKLWPLMHAARPRVLLVDGSGVFDLEYTALKMFTEAQERLRREGITLWLAALNPTVLATIQRSKLSAALGRERMFFNLQMAVEHYQRT